VTTLGSSEPFLGAPGMLPQVWLPPGCPARGHAGTSLPRRGDMVPPCEAQLDAQATGTDVVTWALAASPGFNTRDLFPSSSLLRNLCSSQSSGSPGHGHTRCQRGWVRAAVPDRPSWVSGTRSPRLPSAPSSSPARPCCQAAPLLYLYKYHLNRSSNIFLQ